MTGFELLKSLGDRVKEVHLACNSAYGIVSFGTYRIEEKCIVCIDGRDALVFGRTVESHRFVAPGILLVRCNIKENIIPQKLIDQFDPKCLLNGQDSPIDTDVAESGISNKCS
jgi:hypothetical protein